MARRLTAWLLTIPLAIIGSQVAHAVDYRLVEPDAVARARLLESTGHGYLDLLPLAAAVCTALVAAVLLEEGRASRARRVTRPRAWQFALVAPLVSACQEVFERTAHDGAVGWEVFAEPTFALGLALQLPFALAAFLLARLLLRVAASIGRRPAAQAPAPSRDLRPTWAPVHGFVPRRAPHGAGATTRGPPLVTV